MSDFDRFENPYYEKRFPDQQDKEAMEYSTCSGCNEVISTLEVINGEVLDVYGMAVHDDFSCLKKAVSARIAYMERND
ncbi:hypothetical protein GRF59_14310 [Paenibacillus sp. HJL G12]|uniref:Uncharacterized protein n=1 Tax=Paenibacillus dendrobii TaxID=2691084 RepID=A0A7X3ILD6_9BACL|nr:hypothetical protein [Paenibacillus dendrobii]MWV44790.1 hypothetical protein [Paenibacillus dendrobii]